LPPAFECCCAFVKLGWLGSPLFNITLNCRCAEALLLRRPGTWPPAKPAARGHVQAAG
jgi:hypothetical protein